MPAVKKDTVEAAMKRLETALIERYRAQQLIARGGDRICLPEGMALEVARDTLTDLIASQESKATKEVRIECHWHDGLICFKHALENLFGEVLGMGFRGFFDSMPGEMSIPIDFGVTEQALYGRLAIPGLPFKIAVGHYENEDNPMQSTVVASFEYKRKHAPLIAEIEQAWRKELATHSIFKGKAVGSDYEYLNLRGDLICYHGEQEQRILDANIFTPIRHMAAVEARGIPVRRTVLLYGSYGTGKSLTAREIAKVAVSNHWTFMNVQQGGKIESALEFARMYSPAVVFVEDIDMEAGGSIRTDRINSILNSIDGILSKTAPVITVLTTNNLMEINPAMLRPGRIDVMVELGKLDPSTTLGLVRAYAGSKLEGDLDANVLYAAAQGYTPAFVADAVHRAGLYAVANDHDLIKQEHIVSALEELRAQFDIMTQARAERLPTFDRVMGELVQRAAVAAKYGVAYTPQEK